MLVTCAYLLSDSQPWVEQSLFLAAIGETRDKGVRALEAFAYRYREGTPAAERFLVHRTVFPRDFLADFGFRTVRSAGRIELARLDLGGLQPVEEGAREKVLQVVKEAFQPAPAPAPPRLIGLAETSEGVPAVAKNACFLTSVLPTLGRRGADPATLSTG